MPFGYELKGCGRKNKKGGPAYDLVVLPELVPTVKKLFNKVADEGYGSNQIATWLNKLGYKTTKGIDINSNNILRILRNEVYRGYFVRGD